MHLSVFFNEIVKMLSQINKMLNRMDSVINLFADAYFPLIEEFRNNPCCLGISVPLPSFDALEIEELAQATQETFRSAQPLIELDANIHIIGDIHGNFFDLIRILASLEDPLHENFLFLGDFVDRGSFSLDVVLFLFTFRCKYPDRVHFIRGNHEFRDLNQHYGFQAEITERFQSDELWERINKVFEHFPFAAVINKENLCVHGGIGPSTDMEKIRKIDIPCPTCQTEVITDLVWSDPAKGTNQFLVSDRGRGSLFGRLQLLQFLKASGCARMIRGHQCVNGIERKWNSMLITVFSSSNYSERGNKAGMLYIDYSGNISETVFKNAVWLQRTEVRYRKVTHAEPGWKPMSVKLGSLGRMPRVPRDMSASPIRSYGSPVHLKRRTNSFGALPSFFSGPIKNISRLAPLQPLPSSPLCSPRIDLEFEICEN